jgi:hypothetical protein
MTRWSPRGPTPGRAGLKRLSSSRWRAAGAVHWPLARQRRRLAPIRRPEAQQMQPGPGTGWERKLLDRTQAHIRPYRPADIDALYQICLLTGDGGQDATSRYHDPNLLGHWVAAPYGLFEPSLAFVAEDTSGVARLTAKPSRNGWRATGGPTCALAIPNPRPAFLHSSGRPTSIWRTSSTIPSAPRTSWPRATRHTCTSTCCHACRPVDTAAS